MFICSFITRYITWIIYKEFSVFWRLRNPGSRHWLLCYRWVFCFYSRYQVSSHQKRVGGQRWLAGSLLSCVYGHRSLDLTILYRAFNNIALGLQFQCMNFSGVGTSKPQQPGRRPCWLILQTYSCHSAHLLEALLEKCSEVIWACILSPVETWNGPQRAALTLNQQNLFGPRASPLPEQEWSGSVSTQSGQMLAKVSQHGHLADSHLFNEQRDLRHHSPL